MYLVYEKGKLEFFEVRFLMDIRRIKEFNSDANIQTQLRGSSKKYFSKLEIKYNEELYIF